MNTTRFTITTLSALTALAFTTQANAQDAPTSDAPKPSVEKPGLKNHSVNLNPLGALVGNYSLNYEYLHNGTHGLLIEPSFNRTTGDNGESQTGGGIGFGYRFHWSGEQDSGFVGASVGYAIAQGDASVTVTTNGQEQKTSFDINSSLFYAAANVGRRWAWDSGFNITFRIGGGYGDWKVETDSTDPNAQSAVDAVDAILNIFPIYLDGELSVGYIF